MLTLVKLVKPLHAPIPTVIRCPPQGSPRVGFRDQDIDPWTPKRLAHQNRSKRSSSGKM